MFSGYTSAANDGGIGGISGNGSLAMIAGTPVFVMFKDMHLHNCGSAVIVTLGNGGTLLNCELNNTSGNAASITSGYIINSKFHDIGGAGIVGTSQLFIYGNFFKNGAKSFTTAIAPTGSSSYAGFNIVSIGGSSNGISMIQTGCTIINNSIYSSGGTGTGIIGPTNSGRNQTILNNIMEGFSGAGGEGIIIATGHAAIYGNNKFYNNATHESITANISVNLGNNTALGASPFASPATDNFMVDTSVKAGAYPSSFKGSITNQFLDVGAAQREEAAAGGGGLIRHPGMAGGLNA